MKYKRILKFLSILSVLMLFSCKDDQTEVTGGVAVTTVSPAEGYTNDLVTVTGLNFDPVAENNIVRFGEHVAAVKSATPTELQRHGYNGSGYVCRKTFQISRSGDYHDLNRAR